jgi:hypothetical protein
MHKKAKVIAFYLPQFHPIPENDEWWGKGFTEWTNVGKAKPLFKGHNQPRVPADLGYYDLRIPEVRKLQAEMASESGIEGFCYWHYWFGNGKQLLEHPFKEVLETGEPDFPFCLGWANESWTNKTWSIEKKMVNRDILMEQTYSERDNVNHFYSLLQAFKDKRYLRVNNKPIFVVFKPKLLINAKNFIETWNKLAKQNGLEGIHFVGISNNLELRSSTYEKDQWNLSHFYDVKWHYNSVLDLSFDAINSRGTYRAQMKSETFLSYFFYKFFTTKLHFSILKKYKYSRIIQKYYVEEDTWENVYPTIIPNWDRSPRSGKDAAIWYKSTPELFKKHVEEALEIVKNKKDEHKIIFLQSWNEWGEGNYIEPDIVFGRKYLACLKEAIYK